MMIIPKKILIVSIDIKNNDFRKIISLLKKIIKKHTDSSSSKIGQLIGNKDHATVLHACKIVKDQVEVDKTFKADIEEIEASLKRK